MAIDVLGTDPVECPLSAEMRDSLEMVAAYKEKVAAICIVNWRAFPLSKNEKNICRIFGHIFF